MASILERLGPRKKGAPKENKAKRNEREKRFSSNFSPSTPIHGKTHEFKSPKQLKGLSQSLEKEYLRITGDVDLSTIRPIKVLMKALEHVKMQYSKNYDYTYACEQLKSIRQDLTVQSIQGKQCANVYEIHARMALEHNDLEEYSQCQSRLHNIRGADSDSSDEFDGYRILYSLYVNNNLELARALSEIEKNHQNKIAKANQPTGTGTPMKTKSFPITDFAMKVVKAWKTNNTREFFHLYEYSLKNKSGTALTLNPKKKELMLTDGNSNRSSSNSNSNDNDNDYNSSNGKGSHCLRQCCYLMAQLLQIQRKICLQRILKAYVSLPMDELFVQLHFTLAATTTVVTTEYAPQSNSENGSSTCNLISSNEGMEFLRNQNILSMIKKKGENGESYLDCRTSIIPASAKATTTTTNTSSIGKKRKSNEKDQASCNTEKMSKKDKRKHNQLLLQQSSGRLSQSQAITLHPPQINISQQQVKKKQKLKHQHDKKLKLK
jgi:hypothetical protein